MAKFSILATARKQSATMWTSVGKLGDLRCNICKGVFILMLLRKWVKYLWTEKKRRTYQRV